MYKAILVAQFNREPNISSERLERIRSTYTTKPQSAYQSDSLADSATSVGLYDDVILMKESGWPKYVIAQVICIRRGSQGYGYNVRGKGIAYIFGMFMQESHNSSNENDLVGTSVTMET